MSEKNVNMLLQLETDFIIYVTCLHANVPTHLGIIRVYIVCTDVCTDAQADGLPCLHMS